MNSIPSYADSQLEFITRIQPRPTLCKSSLSPSPSTATSTAPRTVTASSQYRRRRRVDSPSEWSFSGWGRIVHEQLLPSDYSRCLPEESASCARREELRDEKKSGGDASKGNGDDERVLGKWLGSSISGIAVAGSPFYAFPAVVAVASVFSPISLLIATLLLSCWRPLMIDLARVFPFNGANYAYLLNGTTKNLAILAATLTLLDDVATSVVSAATAAAYVASQLTIPFDSAWLTVILLLGGGALGLLGVRTGAGVTTFLLAFHTGTMLALFLAGIVSWSRNGNFILAQNWWEAQPTSQPSATILNQIFQGVCIGFLGVTGFETAPDYISSLTNPSRSYPSILRNLQYIAISLNAPLLLLVYAVLPSASIVGNSSLLSTFAEVVGGRWMSILISIDAFTVLCGGILTGIISATSLLAQLTTDRILPSIFSRQLPLTRAPFVSLIFFTLLCLIMWAASGANLAVVSGMFAIVFLSIILLYPFSSLVLSFTRPSLVPSLLLPRKSFLLAVATLLLSLVLLVGNAVLVSMNAVYFLGYVGVIGLGIGMVDKKARILIGVWWIVRKVGDGEAEGRVERWVRRWIERARGGSVVVIVENDCIDDLVKLILYVQENEDMVSNVKLVHFYATRAEIPSEMIANVKILDEAFPAITIDLILISTSSSCSSTTPSSPESTLPITEESMAKRRAPHDSIYLLGLIAERIGLQNDRWFVSSASISSIDSDGYCEYAEDQDESMTRDESVGREKVRIIL